VLGLTLARRTGFRAARGDVLVLVDDDNVLAPDYLAEVVRLFAAHPNVGALGGRSLPEFETPLPPDLAEFLGLLACRDLGPDPQIAALRGDPLSGPIEYPACAPIGAGMALRRNSVQSWLDDQTAVALPDRKGSALTSGGDNDIVLRILRSGWSVGYFPTLSLTHLIPSGRTSPDYLARLNRGIASSWVQVLSRHGACVWPPVPGWSVPLRQLRAWFTHRAWASRAAYIRWQGACGHFEGRSKLQFL
jgi:GT2 family glycosyltransferase